MIGRLWGLVAEVGEEDALIDVSGVGYVVRCGSRTLGRMPAVGGAIDLHIESQWGEQTGMTLYGFLDKTERRAFVMLKTIQGVGPKAALAVLDVMPPAELSAAAQRGDQAAVARAQGVGPKLALRIVTELKDKAPAFANVDPALVHLSGAIDNDRAPRPVTDAISALVNLGYGPPQAAAAIAGASRIAGEGAETAQLIRLGLKELAK